MPQIEVPFNIGDEAAIDALGVRGKVKGICIHSSGSTSIHVEWVTYASSDDGTGEPKLNDKWFDVNDLTAVTQDESPGG